MKIAPAYPMEHPVPNRPSAARPVRNLRAFALFALLAAGGSAGLYAQSNLLVGPDGQAYFAGQDGIFRIDARTDQVEKLPIALNTTRLLVDAAGNLCGLHMRYDTGTDLWRPAVWRYKKGEAQIVTGREAADTYAFAEVTGPDGCLYFREFDPARGISRLLMREKNNEVTLLAGHSLGAKDGRRTAAQLGRVGAMTLGGDGDLYFTDEGAVRKVSRDGVVTTLAQGGLLTGTTAGGENPLVAIALDENRSIYVADNAHRQVLSINATGKADYFSDYEPNWVVAGLATERGSLFALESNASDTRVRRLNGSLPASTLLAYSADGKPLNRTRSYGLEQRSIIDSLIFHNLTGQVERKRPPLDNNTSR